MKKYPGYTKYHISSWTNVNYTYKNVSAAMWWDRASETFKRFAVYLNILNQDPDILASMFQRLGIKGKRGKPECCPVAKYLAATPALSGVRVGADALLFKGRHIRLPKNVQEFIKGFDRGDYPELESLDTSVQS